MQRRHMIWGFGLLALGGAGAVASWRALGAPKSLSPAQMQAALPPLAAPEGPMAVYHLGHSLVGRDMPLILAQLSGHDHASQLGWGASLGDHWKGDVRGFAEENAHPHHRPAREALASGQYDAVVLTEMVELKDAIRYHDSAAHLAHWAKAARAGRGDVRLYLYETWHPLDDPRGWLERLDADLAQLWLGEVVAGAMARGAGPIYLIPGGQVLGAVARAAEAGDLPTLRHRSDLFARTPDGAVDPIHMGPLGAYVIALTHYATLYHRSPPTEGGVFTLSQGATFEVAPDLAAALAPVVWSVVRAHPQTGLRA